MKVLFEHSGILPVKTYGGTERILFWLMKELVLRGHEVYLIGNPESEVKDIGVKLILKDPKHSDDWRGLVPGGIDIIHLNYPPTLDLKDWPLIVTIHGNGKLGEKFHSNSVFVSKKHAQNHKSDRFVYNGIDFDEYPFKGTGSKQSWNKFAFLGKGRWKVKNLKACISACKRAKKQLHIAGGRSFSFSRYIHSHGMVDQEQKLSILRQMDAFLFPVRWHEPFGLAVIEAYSQGIPVIGSLYGSLPELITPQTGVSCKNYDEFLEVVLQDQFQFDSEAIRACALRHFSVSVMASSYLELYKLVISGQTLNPGPPEYFDQLDSEVLLPF